MKPLSFLFFLFFLSHLTSGFLGLWGGGEEKKTAFEELWLKVPEGYQNAIFDELRKDPSFSSLLREKSTGEPIETMSHRSGAHYSAKAARGIFHCSPASDDIGYIDVYRLGKIEPLAYVHGCTTYRELIESARKKFKDNNIHQFWYRDGTPVFLDNFVAPLPKKSYRQVVLATARIGTSWEGYKEQERFYFAALEVGEVVPLSIHDNAGSFQEFNLTTLSIHPRIFMLDPFLTQKECDDLWYYMNNLPEDSQTNWEVSSVGQDSSDKAENTTTRVSQSLWLGDVHSNRNELTSRVFTRSQTLLHAPTELMEPFQCVKYPPGGHYYFHTDSVPADRLVDNPNPYYRQGGNRYATLLIYVKAPSEGGHTAFPLAEDKRFSYDKTKSLETNPLEGCNRDISFHVGVKKGAAVLFYDLMEEEHMKGVIDPLSEHAGCDTSGEEQKVIMNQWFRNKRVKVGDKWHMYDNNW